MPFKLSKSQLGQTMKWFRKAAEQGHTQAQFALGVSCSFGTGVEKNAGEAVKWYRKAAEQGHSEAQFKLGECYENGNGVQRDYAEAVKWYRKAADQEHAEAQSVLGVFSAKGQGMPKDYTEAAKWFRKAAEQGHADDQCNLGQSYEFGLGVPKDYVQAYKWYNLASTQDHEAAKKNLSYVESLMTPDQIAEAKNLSHDFQSHTPNKKCSTMSPEDILNGTFSFEVDGIKMTDTPKAIFLKEGRPFVGLFVRKSFIHIAPMAVTPMTPAGDVYAVIESDVKGLFTQTVHLILKDGKNNTVKLRLPLASLMRGFEETACWFLAWAKTCSPVIQPPGVNFVALPEWFFARNTSL